MKYLFSFILSIDIASAGIISIQYISNYKSLAIHTQQRLIEKHLVPRNLIDIVITKKCVSRDKRFLELCINKKGELIELSNENSIKKSLKIFKTKG